MKLQLPHLHLDNKVTVLSGKPCHPPICSPGASYCLLMFVSLCFCGSSYQGANLTDMSRPLRHIPVPMNHLILQWRSKEGSYMKGATGLSTHGCRCTWEHACSHTCKCRKMWGAHGDVCFALRSCLSRWVLFFHGLYAKPIPTSAAADLVRTAGKISKNNIVCYNEALWNSNSSVSRLNANHTPHLMVIFASFY